MCGLSLTEELKASLQSQIELECGPAAVPAVAELFHGAEHHGKNYTCELLDECDHVVVAVDCDCAQGEEAADDNVESVIDDLFKQGVILYYDHSILERRHHIRLAIKKSGVAYPLNVIASRGPD